MPVNIDMPRYSRRSALLTLAAAPLASALTSLCRGAVSIACADDYPSRPVKVIVPFGAGGPTDVYTRDIAAELQQVAASGLRHGEPSRRRHHHRHRIRRQCDAGRLHAA